VACSRSNSTFILTSNIIHTIFIYSYFVSRWLLKIVTTAKKHAHIIWISNRHTYGETAQKTKLKIKFRYHLIYWFWLRSKPSNPHWFCLKLYRNSILNILNCSLKMYAAFLSETLMSTCKAVRCHSLLGNLSSALHMNLKTYIIHLSGHKMLVQ
jgi:hypothetical protein